MQRIKVLEAEGAAVVGRPGYTAAEKLEAAFNKWMITEGRDVEIQDVNFHADSGSTFGKFQLVIRFEDGKSVPEPEPEPEPEPDEEESEEKAPRPKRQYRRRR